MNVCENKSKALMKLDGEANYTGHLICSLQVSDINLYLLTHVASLADAFLFMNVLSNS